MLVRDIMKKNPTCVPFDCPIEQAAQLMAELDCGILPVVSDNASVRPIGVLTDRDIVMRCIAAESGDIGNNVGDACTKVAICCDRDCTAEEAFRKMRVEKVGRLMVVDGSGAIVGIVSMADIIAAAPRDILNQLPNQVNHRKAA